MSKKFTSITQYRTGLHKKEFSAREAITELFSHIREKDPLIHAFLEVYEQEALQNADRVDKRIAAGESQGALDGVPMAIKDNILVAGHRATAASRMLESYVASYDATVIEKLKESGAIIIGRTNLDEFAMGASTENSAFGVTKNPYDETKVAGGSSGGSAAAVASGMALGALGSDTGGSIRQPASLCGVVGLKPTYGAVSRYGVIALGSSLDQVGPFGNTVYDTAQIFQIIAGKDSRDATSHEYDVSSITDFDSKKARSKVIGVPKEFMEKGMSAETEKMIQRALNLFKKAGYRIKEISLPHIAHSIAAYYIILPAEASANLARYDGLRYGGKAEKEKPKTENLLQTYLHNRGKGFGDEVRRRILLGTFVLSSGYYDAYYAKAQKVRRLIQNDFLKAFDPSADGVDVIFAPASPSTAFAIGEKVNDPLTMYLEDIYTTPVNLAGLPGISIPIESEFSKDNMPIGFQLIGKHWGEYDILNIGNDYETNLRSEF